MANDSNSQSVGTASGYPDDKARDARKQGEGAQGERKAPSPLDELAERSKAAAADTVDTLGKAAESALGDLEEAVPALAGYVRNAADYTHKLADDLRDKKAGDLISSALAWGRHQPLMLVVGGALLGFVLARVVKSGVEGGSESPPPS